MPLFPRRTDPLQQRAKELNSEIARLEKELRTLARPDPAPAAPARPAHPPAAEPAPRFRQPAARPTPSPPPATAPAATRRPARPAPTPPVSRSAPRTVPATPIPADDHYNASGLRKFDLSGLWSRIARHLHGPTANNPRMVQYLAVGSVQGLRPLRYEKRIARNRFIGLFLLLLAILWGLAYVYIHQTRPRATSSITIPSVRGF